MKIDVGPYEKVYLNAKKIKRKNKSLISKLKSSHKRCQNCDYHNNCVSHTRLHASHIIPFSAQCLDITKDDKLNIFILCPNCHVLYDYGPFEQKLAIHNNIIEKFNNVKYISFEEKIEFEFLKEIKNELNYIKTETFNFTFKTTRSGKSYYSICEKFTRSGKRY